MLKLIACDSNSSRTHSISINPSTKKEFKKDVKSFTKEVDKIFSKWFFDINDSDATKKQTKWAEELL